MSEPPVSLLRTLWSYLYLGIQHSYIELIFYTLFFVGVSTGDGQVHPLILWSSFVAASVWVLLTCTEDAHVEAKLCVLEGSLSVADFIVCATILIMAAFLLRHQDWYFPAMLLIAAAQNIRYTVLSVSWANEDTCE
jgi:hypothetical protein